jgi:hypothetical protein
MRHDLLSKALCGTYVQLSDRAGYLRSNLSIDNDGTLLGAYFADAGQGRVRITDDGDTLFYAAVNGVEISEGRAKKYREIAHSCGISLADDGVLNITCEVDSVGYFTARLIEAADRISYLSVSHRPKPHSRFEAMLAVTLKAQFARAFSRNFKVLGASGHTLRFPFALSATNGRATPTLIQPVSATDGKIDWGNVYQAAGKFQDLANNHSLHARRVAILEEVAQDQMAQASTALAVASDVIVYRDPESLHRALAA